MIVRRWLLAMAALTLLAGCGPEVVNPGPLEVGDPGPEELRQQARAALDRYDQAVRRAGDGPRFVPVGRLDKQFGDWEAGNEQNKSALLAGLVSLAAELPALPRPAGVVVWADGTRLTVPLAAAGASLSGYRVDGSPDCDGCTPLRVTGAKLGTLAVDTTRGPATVPAWEFTLAGTSVRLARVAVDPSVLVQVSPPVWDARSAGSLRVEAAVTRRGSRSLTVSFTGSRATGDEPCGMDYTAEAVESDSAVVVIVYSHPYPSPLPEGQGCLAIGAERSAAVELGRELGERAVLDAQQGLPVRLLVN
ncbi:hypothetical protein AB0H57_19850 [Micromonospora sp. NPDC050686]|uniref:hypothetical protein n=1 Tax=Micromonospora sp. NPDC050686 TaxID=3154631 RepID=UPI00340F18A5